MCIRDRSGGSVTTLDDALQWVKVRTKGGRYKGQEYRSGIREQAKGMFYNPVTHHVTLNNDLGVNYMMYGINE